MRRTRGLLRFLWRFHELRLLYGLGAAAVLLALCGFHSAAWVAVGAAALVAVLFVLALGRR